MHRPLTRAGAGLRAPLPTLALLFAAVLALLSAAPAHAGGIEARRASLSQTEDGTVLSADFDIDLGPRIEDVVSRGVPLTFNLEFEITRPRWWWSSEAIVTRNATYKLSYAALTRQYRLSSGALHRNFATLEEAVRVLGRVNEMAVAERGVLRTGESYAAGIRLYLDRNLLPKPLQVDAIGNKDWQLDSRVFRWNYAPGAIPAPAPVPAVTEAKP